MEAGWQLAKQYGGRMIVGKASNLSPIEFPDGSYDLVDNSFALHWSKLEPNKNDRIESSERVKILTQINRVLKEGGRMILTLPETCFDERQFFRFVEALEKHFGFKIDRNLSGKSFGRSKLRLAKRLGWCIVATKVSNPNLSSLDINSLQFVNEQGNWVNASNHKKNGVGVQARDYPSPTLQIDFEQYEIIDANGLVTTLTTKDDIINPVGQEITIGEENVDVNEEALIAETDKTVKFLKGSNKDEYKAYRNSLLKPVRKITGKNWEEAEQECIEIMEEIQQSGVSFSSRIKAFSEILKRIRRKYLKNGRREVS